MRTAALYKRLQSPAEEQPKEGLTTTVGAVFTCCLFLIPISPCPFSPQLRLPSLARLHLSNNVIVMLYNLDESASGDMESPYLNETRG